MKFFTLELLHIEINASSSVRTVQLAKAKAIAHLLTFATAFSCRHFKSRNGNLNVLCNKTNWNPDELTHCQTSIFYGIFYLMQLKPQKGNQSLISEYGQMKTENTMSRAKQSLHGRQSIYQTTQCAINLELTYSTSMLLDTRVHYVVSHCILTTTYLLKFFLTQLRQIQE